VEGGGFGGAMARAEGFEEHFEGVEEVSSHGCGGRARLECVCGMCGVRRLGEWDWLELVDSIEDGERIREEEVTEMDRGGMMVFNCLVQHSSPHDLFVARKEKEGQHALKYEYCIAAECNCQREKKKGHDHLIGLDQTLWADFLV
jgi:hypothetical protein